jgi:hypothetical protein
MGKTLSEDLRVRVIGALQLFSPPLIAATAIWHDLCLTRRHHSPSSSAATYASRKSSPRSILRRASSLNSPT